MIGRDTNGMAIVQGASLKERILHRARALGFDLAGVAPADPMPGHRGAAQERVRAGAFQGMSWFTQERVQRASDPRALLPGAQSVIVVGLSYLPPEEASPSLLVAEGDRGSVLPPHGSGPAHVLRQAQDERDCASAVGKVARYARWVDYHQVMKAKLRDLAVALRELTGPDTRARVFVDDGALLERAFAERAGLGWFGKNTNILTQPHGSWVFLGALITDLPLEPDQPLKKTCGDCVRCIPACPTGAIVAPYVLDARRCISYLTIEHRGPVPRDLRSLMGDWVFGCDICQEVCPVNRDVQGAAMPELKRTGFDALELVPLLSMTQEEFSQRFRDTPIKRAKLEGLQRNACIALGNLCDASAVPALGKALREGGPLVRGHAAWALGRITTQEAARLLEEALATEGEGWVREEIEQALAGLGSTMV